MSPTVSGSSDLKAAYLRSLLLYNEVYKLKSTKLHLYHIDMKYIRDLAKADDKVMSVSPQVGKESRPFVGIVVVCDKKPYCIPLTSPKPKHQQMKNDKDFSKMLDKKGKLIGAINFNNMIPITQSVITPIDIKVHSGDSPKDKAYKELLNDQLDWCNQNRESIVKKANKLYSIVTETPDKFRNLTRRCCDFKKLEAVLQKRLEKIQDEPSKPTQKGYISRASLKKTAKKLSQERSKAPERSAPKKKRDTSLE